MRPIEIGDVVVDENDQVVEFDYEADEHEAGLLELDDILRTCFYLPTIDQWVHECHVLQRYAALQLMQAANIGVYASVEDFAFGLLKTAASVSNNRKFFN